MCASVRVEPPSTFDAAIESSRGGHPLLIWHRGEIIPADALRIPIQDRVFEHGLGLFETFRTWNGLPTLLDRHLARIQRSAHELGLPLEPEQLPDRQAVPDLIEATGHLLEPGLDVRLRLTLTGGIVSSDAALNVMWMTASPLPVPVPGPGAVVSRIMQVAGDDTLARHKTLNYWRKRMAQAEGAAHGSDDVLCTTADGLVCETSRANIFIIEGRRLSTPGLDGPLLPGIMRSVVLERATTGALDLGVSEAPLSIDRIRNADEAFLTSSLRGILPIARLLDRVFPTPGPITGRLWNEILPWLQQAEGAAP